MMYFIDCDNMNYKYIDAQIIFIFIMHKHDILILFLSCSLYVQYVIYDTNIIISKRIYGV